MKDWHILLTRPDDGEDAWLCDALRQRGAHVSRLPCIRTHAIPFTLDNLRGFPVQGAPSSWDWLFFTSRNGVHGFFKGLKPHGDAEITRFAKIPVAAVGPKTALAVEKICSRPTMFVSDILNAEGAARQFCQQHDMRNRRVLWPCGNLAKRTPIEILNNAGAHMLPLVVYETLPPDPAYYMEHNPFTSERPPDVMIFTSPSAVTGYNRWLRLSDPDVSIPVITACLGPITALEAERHWGHMATRIITPEKATLESLLEMLETLRLPAAKTSPR